jgi:Bacterial DNA polymerase III alpha NTPase domain
MQTNTYGEIVLDEHDLCDLVMQGRPIADLKRVTLDRSVDLEPLIFVLEDPASLATWTFAEDSDVSVPDWDSVRQQHWHMPESYAEMDIAAYVLGLCKTDAELQRAGHELMLYQERGLFDLLRYLKYLVDVMTENHVIWGVGRGSSVASYVLYLLGVHRINSMYYDLDVGEFLR